MGSSLNRRVFLVKHIRTVFLVVSSISLNMPNLGFSTVTQTSIQNFYNENSFSCNPLHLDSKITSQAKSLMIVNASERPIRNCFPLFKHSGLLTLETLAKELSESSQPEYQLYKIWKKHVKPIEGESNLSLSPLAILNYLGTCSKEDYSLQFMRLCDSLGIETRFTDAHRKHNNKNKNKHKHHHHTSSCSSTSSSPSSSSFDPYDSCKHCRSGSFWNSFREINVLNDGFDVAHDDDWFYIDFEKNQVFLDWDNETPLSSERMMDDPLLALRAKMTPKDQAFDQKKSWEYFANWNVIHPAPYFSVPVENEVPFQPVEGFEFFPEEKLVFVDDPDMSMVNLHHVIDLQKRAQSGFSTYHSPLPILRIYNNSTVPVSLTASNVIINPGESLPLMSNDVFQIQFTSLANETVEVIIETSCSRNLIEALPTQSESPQGFEIQHFKYDNKKAALKQSDIQILNHSPVFDYTRPVFHLDCGPCDKIWWQISKDKNFDFVPENFELIQSETDQVSLPLLSETFFNPRQTYYFRVKAYHKGAWEEWTEPFSFKIQKPEQIPLVEFYELGNQKYELNWEREAEDVKDIEYLVFGSNSIDFIPSIYADRQVNAILNGEVIDEEANDTFIALTKEAHFEVDGSLAYYRVIAKVGDQFSVPSALIRVYDNGLIQPRNVLQVDYDDQDNEVVKRVLFPKLYAWDHVALPQVDSSSQRQKTLIDLYQKVKRALEENNDLGDFPYNPHVPKNEWDEAKKYFLPSNHPARSKLDRLFSSRRVTQTPDTFKDSGFKRFRPGRFNRIMASTHSQLKEYFIKAFADSELGIKNDWMRLRHRIHGSMVIRECITKHGYQKMFKVPHKWLYPLPENPSPPSSQSYLRKNFILVAQNMRILEHKQNNKAYKNKITEKTLDAMYTIFMECGLYDSVFNFNVPFTKDGPLAFIDTEYFYRWPINLSKMSKYFSSDMRKYWEFLIANKGLNKANPQ